MNTESLVGSVPIPLGSNKFYYGLFHDLINFLVDDSNFKHESLIVDLLKRTLNM